LWDHVYPFSLLIIDSHIKGQLCRQQQGENAGLTQTDTTDAVLRTGSGTREPFLACAWISLLGGSARGWRHIAPVIPQWCWRGFHRSFRRAKCAHLQDDKALLYFGNSFGAPWTGSSTVLE